MSAHEDVPQAVAATEFRKAVGAFPTGVAVAATWDAHRDEPLGVTISSFNSVSLEPPLVLFSLSRRAHGLSAWVRAAGYAISILSSEQQALSERFARPLTEKWSGVNYRHGLYGAPLVDGAAAHLECAAYRQYDGGDHIIFVGQVKRLSLTETAAPLVFYRGRYAWLDSQCA
jgi:flavin reductase (DIM6/NTAB) family NADH-FMN oxidoreductase RutF